MQVKQKVCYSCQKLSYIYKRIDGKPYCKFCAYKKEGKSSSIKPVSTKRSNELKEYSVIRQEFLKAHPICQAKLVGCTQTATEVHHMVGRENKRLLDSKHFLAICRSCHTKITEDTKLALELVLSLSKHKSNE